MKSAAALVAAATLALPAPSLTTPGHLEALTASGPTAALATGGCTVRLVDLSRGTRPMPVRGALPCTDAGIVQLALGRTAVAAVVDESPSPHSERFTLWRAPRPAGPFRQVGAAWGWNDSDVPTGFGCARAVVAGGAVVATAQVPNRLAVEQGLATEPSCPAGETTTIALDGAARPRLFVSGSWRPLATDGKRLVLARLDPQGQRTGEAELVDLAGRKLPVAQPDPPIVRGATAAWLAPEGLVTRTGPRIFGKGWSVGGVRAAAVGEGRVVYAAGAQLRVRRIGGGPDRLLLRLPAGEAALAAGSFGVAMAIGRGSRVSLYRLPWRTIDRTLTR
jgi:hypothetical protein